MLQTPLARKQIKTQKLLDRFAGYSYGGALSAMCFELANKLRT